ncbi:hypothetical protein [Paraflavitalea sp. CAU 1676]|uniref:hypothetical protein n=1 Tax=Paraflavitalea sp. CAU 1676 TaxID=3032598 RepID=UPI0023DB8B9E|nr:hypothetical protein [Paraflavitalea sp. CAU 1676]MDF2188962.1 hypothetical protein [Paraflavitalea sp. CAU 1676]
MKNVKQPQNLGIYYLMHKILDSLVEIALVQGSGPMLGKEDEGEFPFYEFHIRSAQMHFGTLVQYLNDKTKIKGYPFEPKSIQSIRLNVDEISEFPYTFKEVSAALEILYAQGDIVIERRYAYEKVHIKEIRLLPSGFITLNTQTYLRRYQSEKTQDEITASTIRTNSISRINVFVSGAFAFVAAITSIFSLYLSMKQSDRDMVRAYREETQWTQAQNELLAKQTEKTQKQNDLLVRQNFELNTQNKLMIQRLSPNDSALFFKGASQPYMLGDSLKFTPFTQVNP